MLKRIAKTALARAGYEVRRQRDEIPEMKGLLLLDQLRCSENPDLKTLVRFIVDNLDRSEAQIFQDLFVLHTLGRKTDGYFVDIGAADGRFISNTFLLEKAFGWSGIAAEPSRKWHHGLSQNRSCNIDTRAVWKSSGERLQFVDGEDPTLSTLDTFKARDLYNYAPSYGVDTISLNDLLDHHHAPIAMDYLSIDTEGSEIEILRAFDFPKRSFRVITVEHNYQHEKRAEIFDLLTSNGYRRKFESISLWDDWYVRP